MMKKGLHLDVYLNLFNDNKQSKFELV